MCSNVASYLLRTYICMEPCEVSYNGVELSNSTTILESNVCHMTGWGVTLYICICFNTARWLWLSDGEKGLIYMYIAALTMLEVGGCMANTITLAGNVVTMNNTPKMLNKIYILAWLVGVVWPNERVFHGIIFTLLKFSLFSLPIWQKEGLLQSNLKIIQVTNTKTNSKADSATLTLPKCVHGKSKTIYFYHQFEQFPFVVKLVMSTLFYEYYHRMCIKCQWCGREYEKAVGRARAWAPLMNDTQ